MIYGKKLNIVIVNYCLCENKWFKIYAEWGKSFAVLCFYLRHFAILTTRWTRKQVRGRGFKSQTISAPTWPVGSSPCYRSELSPRFSRYYSEDKVEFYDRLGVEMCEFTAIAVTSQNEFFAEKKKKEFLLQFVGKLRRRTGEMVGNLWATKRNLSAFFFFQFFIVLNPWENCVFRLVLNP